MAKQQLRAGQLLHDARYRQQLSLEEVSQALHIPVRQLEALEQDDISPFAAEIYARGAAVKYAKFLRIDAQQVQRALLRSTKDTRTPVTLLVPTPARWFERWQHPRVVIGAIVLLLACIVGGYFLLQLRSFWELPSLSITNPVEDVVTEKTVTLTGVSEPDVRIRINDEPVLLQKDNTFMVEVGLQPGINTFVISAENAAGRKRVVTRHILMPHEQSTLQESGQ